jgi:DnaK suppressor protein
LLAVGPSGDVADTAQQAIQREMAGRDLNRNSQLTHMLREALERIADGSYGACAHCAEPIAPRRLAAVPWAPLCLACQEEAERGRRLDTAA